MSATAHPISSERSISEFALSDKTSCNFLCHPGLKEGFVRPLGLSLVARFSQNTLSFAVMIGNID